MELSNENKSIQQLDTLSSFGHFIRSHIDTKLFKQASRVIVSLFENVWVHKVLKSSFHVLASFHVSVCTLPNILMMSILCITYFPSEVYYLDLVVLVALKF